MNTDSNFSLANRKELADLLSDQYDGLRSKAKSRFHDKRRALRESLIKELAAKKGATTLISQIGASIAKTQELKDELSQLGFCSDGEDVVLSGSFSSPGAKIIDAKLKIALGSVEDIDARFDSAQIAMMTVASLEDADKILKSVSAI